MPTFLGEPERTEAAARLYDADQADDGYVWNVTRLWAWRPDVHDAFGSLRTLLTESSSLGERDWAVLVTAAAARRGDSYCSLAWGTRLAELVDPVTAGELIGGRPGGGLTPREVVLAEWAASVVDDPNATTTADVSALRRVGLSEEEEIFEATVFIALRLAFSTVNDALGEAPDRQLAERAPGPVRAAVQWGRVPGLPASDAS